MKQADEIWNPGPELIDDDGEVRELTKEDFVKMVPFAQLPQDMQEFLLSIKHAKVRPLPAEEDAPTARSVA